MHVTNDRCLLLRQALSLTAGRIGSGTLRKKFVMHLTLEHPSKVYAYIRSLTSRAGEMTATAKLVFGVWLIFKATGRYIFRWPQNYAPSKRQSKTRGQVTLLSGLSLRAPERRAFSCINHNQEVTHRFTARRSLSPAQGRRAQLFSSSHQDAPA